MSDNENANVHQTWDQDRQQWKVQSEGAEQAASYHDTEKEAREAAQTIARNRGTDWIKHRQEDNTIQERRSYSE